MSYLIHVNDILDTYGNNLCEYFNSINGKPIDELKLKDLAFYNGAPIYSGNGVYIFKYPEEYVYIGDCSSKNFIERIPGHLDIRTTGWMNSLLKNVCKKRGLSTDKNEHFTIAASEIIEKASLILINFDFHKTDHAENVRAIDKLENVLIAALKPYSPPRNKRQIDLSKKVRELIHW